MNKTDKWVRMAVWPVTHQTVKRAAKKMGRTIQATILFLAEQYLNNKPS